MLARLAPCSGRSDLAGRALLAAAAGLLIAGGVIAGSLLAVPAPADTCAMPAGVSVASLDARARTLVARRLLVCHDLEAGRISRAQYATAVASIDAQFREPAAAPATVWASAVRGVSSEYSATSWAATQALGAPDVYPAHGDLAKAWASKGADDQAEWIELGFETPRAISAVEIYETFNPGAVARVELVTTSGRRIPIQPDRTPPGPTSRKLRLDVACTSEPIAAVRVDLDSPAVTGWNELDAVGIVPCTEP